MVRFHSEERMGKPVKVAGYNLYPVEKLSLYQPPGMGGVISWHRPSAVIIQHEDGSKDVVDIQDPTRRAQYVLLAFGLIGSIVMLLIEFLRNRN